MKLNDMKVLDPSLNCIILHIPHSSKLIPEKYLRYFYLNKNELDQEINLMTDHFTDDLFDVKTTNISSIKFPVSRLLVDPERFELDQNEPMSKVGMGCLYEKTSYGKKLKNINKIREKLLDGFYRPHHKKLENLVKSKLNNYENIIIIDCHSFPKKRLPYEISKEKNRPEICIGTDNFHTPEKLKNFLKKKFRDFDLSVDIDTPFSGSIVPNSYYKLDKRVISIMIEVRRDLYIDEKTFIKNQNYNKIKNILNKIIKSVELDYLNS